MHTGEFAVYGLAIPAQDQPSLSYLLFYFQSVTSDLLQVMGIELNMLMKSLGLRDV